MEEASNLLQKLRKVFVEHDNKSVISEENISKRERKMISNVFAYMDTDVKDIMTHRKHILALDGNELLEDALHIMLEENHSRFPVYENDIDGIIGIVHLRDAMRCYFDESLRMSSIKDLKECVRPACFIPETKPIDKLFQEMQKNKRHLAVVIDEYGQTAGIVTMEDIIEEIVGNIQDEYDNEEEMIVKQKDGSYICNGMAQLDDIEDLIGFKLEEEDYDTLNGYLVDRLDHIPEKNEKCTIQSGSYVFEVLSVGDKVIRKVRIKKVDEQ